MFTTRTKNLSEADVYGVRAYICTRDRRIHTGPYRYIGAWGRRYGCARAFSQPQGTNHYFIFHFVYFNSGGDASRRTTRTQSAVAEREMAAEYKEEKTKTARKERKRKGEKKKGRWKKNYIGRWKKEKKSKGRWSRGPLALPVKSIFVAPSFFLLASSFSSSSSSSSSGSPLRAAALFCDTH